MYIIYEPFAAMNGYMAHKCVWMKTVSFHLRRIPQICRCSSGELTSLQSFSVSSITNSNVLHNGPDSEELAAHT